MVSLADGTMGGFLLLYFFYLSAFFNSIFHEFLFIKSGFFLKEKVPSISFCSPDHTVNK